MQSKSRSRWGNKFGIILLPVYYHKGVGSPLDYVKKAKTMIDKKKRSLEAHFSYRIGYIVMNFLGSKVKYQSIWIKIIQSFLIIVSVWSSAFTPWLISNDIKDMIIGEFVVSYSIRLWSKWRFWIQDLSLPRGDLNPYLLVWMFLWITNLFCLFVWFFT